MSLKILFSISVNSGRIFTEPQSGEVNILPLFTEIKKNYCFSQGSKLTLANSQNASAFDNLRVRKIATSKRLRVRIIHVYQTFGNNLQVISPVCQQKKILLAKLCKWTKKLTSSLGFSI